MSVPEVERPPSLDALTPYLRELGSAFLAWANAHDRRYASPEVGAIPLRDTTHCLQTYQRCPVCASWDTEGRSVSIEDGLAFQEVSGQNCRASWRDVYVLSGYDDLDVGESPFLGE